MNHSAIFCVAIIFCFTVIASSSSSWTTVSAFSIAPRFTVDLSLPPTERWNGVVNLILSKHPWENSFGPLYAHYQSEIYSKLSSETKQMLEETVQTRHPENYQELQGLAKQFASVGHSEIDTNWLCFWSWFHELDHASDLDDAVATKQQHHLHSHPSESQKAAARHNHRDCTGILVLPQDPSLPVLHGRNLDQSQNPARNLTLQISFIYKEPSNLIFTATDFYWMSSGFVTAQMHQGVTLEENWRYNHPPLTLNQILTRIKDKNTVPQVLMFRLLLSRYVPSQRPVTLDDALTFLNTSQFASPFYGIMSGFSQNPNVISCVDTSTGCRAGVVLSAAFNATENIVEVLSDSSSSSSSSWFMVQTNYDRWKPDPADDPRRTVAEDALKMLTREYGSNELGVYQVISEYPVHNENTFYTVLMTMNKTSPGFIRRSMVPLN